MGFEGDRVGVGGGESAEILASFVNEEAESYLQLSSARIEHYAYLQPQLLMQEPPVSASHAFLFLCCYEPQHLEVWLRSYQ